MREIRFRGKRVDNGEWHYGGYFKAADGTTWILGDDGISYRPDAIEVDPTTVGQYIDWEDVNKVKIFTGDIVKADLYEPGYMYVAHPYVCEVVFKGFCYMLKVIGHADKSGFKPGKVPKIPDLMQYSHINLAENLTVIGGTTRNCDAEKDR